MNESTICKQLDQEQKNQDLSTWVASMDDYKELKKMLTNIGKTSLRIVLMVII